MHALTVAESLPRPFRGRVERLPAAEGEPDRPARCVQRVSHFFVRRDLVVLCPMQFCGQASLVDFFL